MGKRVVAMAAIPGKIPRGNRMRTSLSYLKYGHATWEWWCRKNGVEFVLLNKPYGGAEYEALPPTIQRWLAAKELFREYGSDARIAFVDADTMIHWDAPNLFDEAGSQFAAVQDWTIHWVNRSIRAYQHIFPEVSLPWWDYFNSGVVVFGEAELPLFDKLTRFVQERWADLYPITQSADVGTDQTVLNYLVRRDRHPFRYLPPRFNLVNCVQMTPDLWMMELSADLSALALDQVTLSPKVFHFVEMAYVWHFTNVVAVRELLMKETWRHMSAHYPGAKLLED